MSSKLINDIQNLIDAIYDQDSSAGPLHAVLHDGDLSDGTLQWCLNNTIECCNDIVMKVLCTTCGELLLNIPQEERIKLVEV